MTGISFPWTSTAILAFPRLPRHREPPRVRSDVEFGEPKITGDRSGLRVRLDGRLLGTVQESTEVVLVGGDPSP